MEEFNNAQLQNAKNHSHWKPPKDGKNKLNFDGSVDSVAKKGGIGIIIRNEEGLVMGAYARNKPGIVLLQVQMQQ